MSVTEDEINDFIKKLPTNSKIKIQCYFLKGMPCCQINITSSEITDDEMSTCLISFDLFLCKIREKKVKYYFIFDLHDVLMVPISRIVELAKRCHDHEDVIDEYLLCSSVIVHNAAIKGVVQMGINISPPRRTLEIFLQEERQNIKEFIKKHRPT